MYEGLCQNIIMMWRIEIVRICRLSHCWSFDHWNHYRFLPIHWGYWSSLVVCPQLFPLLQFLSWWLPAWSTWSQLPERDYSKLQFNCSVTNSSITYHFLTPSSTHPWILLFRLSLLLLPGFTHFTSTTFQPLSPFLLHLDVSHHQWTL